MTHSLTHSLRLLVPLPGLLLVLDNVLLLQLPHPLDLVQIDHKALVVRMVLLDALSAEDSQVVGTVEVLDPLLVLVAHLLLKGVLIILVQVEVSFRQDGVLLDHLVENVDIEGQSLRTLQLLDQLPANGASHTVLVMQLLDAIGAQGVATMNKDAGDSLAHVVLQSAELTDVKASGLIVQIHYVHLQHSNMDYN